MLLAIVRAPWVVVLLFAAAGVAGAADGRAETPPSDAPPAAPPPPCEPDEIRLVDGRMYRGRLQSAVPHGEVSFESLGTRYRFAWSDVHALLRGVHCAPCAAGPSPSGPGVVRLHIVSEDPSLQLRSEGYTVCQAPCGRMVDGRYHRPFFFTGDDTETSGQIDFGDYQGDVTADVRGGSMALFGLGIAGSALGVLLFTIAATQATEEDPDVGPAGQWALGISGGSLAVGGVVMIAFSPTRIELSAGRPGASTVGRASPQREGP
jgi:hypothetical protein